MTVALKLTDLHRIGVPLALISPVLVVIQLFVDFVM